MRSVIAVIVGCIAGGITVGVIQMGMMLINPPPADLDMNDKEALQSYVDDLSAGELGAVVASHAIGSAMGAFVCSLIARRKFWIGWLIVGVFFLVADAANDLFGLQHPTWFVVTDLLLAIPAAIWGGYCGAAVGKKKRDVQPEEGDPQESGSEDAADSSS